MPAISMSFLTPAPEHMGVSIFNFMQLHRATMNNLSTLTEVKKKNLFLWIFMSLHSLLCLSEPLVICHPLCLPLWSSTACSGYCLFSHCYDCGLTLHPSPDMLRRACKIQRVALQTRWSPFSSCKYVHRVTFYPAAAGMDVSYSMNSVQSKKLFLHPFFNLTTLLFFFFFFKIEIWEFYFKYMMAGETRLHLIYWLPFVFWATK